MCSFNLAPVAAAGDADDETAVFVARCSAAAAASGAGLKIFHHCSMLFIEPLLQRHFLALLSGNNSRYSILRL